MRIGVLTGGGDCPGLNAAIRAVVRKALDIGHEVLGIQGGWLGLLQDKVIPLTLASVSGILTVGGTMLYTSRTNPAKVDRGYDQVIDALQRHRIDALLPIGGDDTLSVGLELHRRGVPVVGLPKTIDNDLGMTDFCIGFDSAVAVVTDALDKLHTTATSHHRVMVLEVMGRDTGWVALYGGLAGGADWIMIPEVPADLDETCRHLNFRRSLGKDFSLIVVAEGVSLPEVGVQDAGHRDAFGHVRLDKRNIGQELSNRIEAATGFETRVTVLGHLQRGGSPTVFDRILATRLGVEAVKMIQYGMFGQLPIFHNNQIMPASLEDAIAGSPKQVPIELFQLAQLFY